MTFKEMKRRMEINRGEMHTTPNPNEIVITYSDLELAELWNYNSRFGWGVSKILDNYKV